MKLQESLESVTDRESFVRFVKLLIEDRKESVALTKQNPEKYQWVGALGWENGTIENYLDGALACFEDGKWHQEMPEEASWRTFAEFLYGGKIYE